MRISQSFSWHRRAPRWCSEPQNSDLLQARVSHSLSLKGLSGGGLWGGDTSSSPGVLEEPKKSPCPSGSNHRRSGGGRQFHAFPKEGLLSQGGHQILFSLRAQLGPQLEFPKPGGDQSLPPPPQFSLPVTWALRSLFFSTSHIKGKWCP